MRRLLIALAVSGPLLLPLHTVADSDHFRNHQEDPITRDMAESHSDRGDARLDNSQEQETVTSMADRYAHMGPHFRWTHLRPVNPQDQEKTSEIVATLRQILEPYRDYKKAVKDGYEPFLPNVKQPHYHFTNKWRGFTAAFRFNTEQPTSLLYTKTADGYELEGVMFTAPKWANENDLDKRIPLSVAQWHAHINICLPPKRDAGTADWKQFGPNGSILTEKECREARGRWFPQLFGWMVHVYPFKDTPDQIWTH